jgi:hypothetical protein
MTDDAPRPAGLAPGQDEDDPYEDVAIEDLPEWWRENVTRFRDHRMRPYRPPQFADGSLLPERVTRLEADLGVEIRIRKRMGPDGEGDWTVLVDGRPAADVDRVRTEEGRSVYSVTAAEFERLVREAADSSRT